MKNIYKIKLILLALVVFSSCAVNDDDPVQNLVSKTVLSLDTAFERASLESYDLVVNVSVLYTSDAADEEERNDCG